MSPKLTSQNNAITDIYVPEATAGDGNFMELLLIITFST